MGLKNYSPEQKAERNKVAENCVNTLGKLYSKVSEIFTEKSFDEIFKKIREECSSDDGRFSFASGNYSVGFGKAFNNKLKMLDSVVNKEGNLKTWWQKVKGNLKNFFNTEDYIDKTKKEFEVRRFNQIMEDFNFENRESRRNLKATLGLSSEVFSPSHFKKKLSGISDKSSEAVTALRNWMGFMNKDVLSADIAD